MGNFLWLAKVLNVDLNEAYHMAVAEVTEDQLSLAIGKRGQNVRLAAELTGWKIDIKSSAPAKTEEADKTETPESAEPDTNEGQT